MKRILPLLLILVFQTCLAEWEPCNNGMWGNPISAIAIDSNNIYAGTKTGILYRSTDYGENWTKKVGELINSPGYFREIKSIQISGKKIVAWFNKGFYISTDNGSTWDEKIATTYYNIASHMIKGDSIFLVSDYYPRAWELSIDNGNTWVPAASLNPVFNPILSGDNIFAINYDTVYVSRNSGANWSILNLDANFKPKSIRSDGSIIAILGDYNNKDFYYSFDFGITWTKSSNLPGSLSSLSIVITDNNIYAIKYGKEIYVSKDSCKSWNQIGSAAIQYQSISSLKVNMGKMLIGNAINGVMLSTDDGTTWTEKNSGIINTNVSYLVAEGNTVLAGSYQFGSYGSSDNGDNWNLKMPAPKVNYSFSISGKNIWAGPYLSIDNGINWTNKWTKSNGNVVSKGDTAWLRTSEGIYLSTDNGNNWTIKTEYKTDGAMGTNGPILFLGRNSGSGQLLTTDMGDNWKWLDAGLGCSDISSCVISDSYILFGTKTCGFYQSSDFGTSWLQINSGLPDTTINALACTGRNIFAGTKRGVYVSHNYGDSWSLINTSLPSFNVIGLAAGKEYLYASIADGGVYRIKIEGFLSAEEDSPDKDESTELLGYYTILGEKLQNIDGYHGLLLKVQMKDGKMVAEKVVLE